MPTLPRANTTLGQNYLVPTLLRPTVRIYATALWPWVLPASHAAATRQPGRPRGPKRPAMPPSRDTSRGVAYVVMAYMVMAYVVMAYVGLACIVMACIAMAVLVARHDLPCHPAEKPVVLRPV